MTGFSSNGVPIRPYEQRTLISADEVLRRVGPTLDPPIVIDAVSLSDVYPDTRLVAVFHEADNPRQQFGWGVRLWDWEHGPLRDILADDPAHLADMLVSNLEEIVDSDVWSEYGSRTSDQTIWVKGRDPV